RELALEDVGRQKPLEQVVGAAVSLAARETEQARDGIRLENYAHGVRGHAEPVLRRPALAFEVGRRQRAVRADALENPPGNVRIFFEEELGTSAGAAAKPRELSCRNERQAFVVRLEDLAPLVKLVAPRRVVAGDARVEHEIVAAARDRNR